MAKWARVERARREKRDKESERLEALSRARGGLTMSNYPAIFQGFMEKGIPEDQIIPRVNVFTYDAWRALGRYVRKGEHGVKVLTYVNMEVNEKSEPQYDENEMLIENKKRPVKRPRMTAVFHVSQTEAIEEKEVA